MKNQKIWKIVGIVAIILCTYLLTKCSYNSWQSTRQGIIYSPSTGSIYEASLYCCNLGKPWEIHNPFKQPNRNDIRYLTYIGTLEDLNKIKEEYDRLFKDDPNAALDYLSQSRKDYYIDKKGKLKIDFDRMFPCVKSRPLWGLKGKDLMPIEWQWVLQRDIDESDLGVLDLVILGGSTKEQLVQWKAHGSLESKSGREFLFLPKCLLIRGKTIILLQNEGHFYVAGGAI